MAYASPQVSLEWEHFLATDVDRNGEVSASEMQQMLAAAGLVFSLQTVMKLITLHSPRERGSLDFQEFQNVQSFLRNIQASFQYFDATRTGRLNKSEVLRALHHAGFGHVDEGAVKSACQAFDPDRTNALSLDQYIAMTLFLLSAKRAFDAFDATQPGSGRITLDFNQFVYAASKTR
jgi:Ca2+-binding EF-hand superfamily protein|tara:strand:- start:18162 stop:18692 length:531 start_codon:yes stop_codon:yes gene_type:complete